MDRTERTLLTVSLITVAGPAAASDFRGFFSLFMATPILAFIALVSGFILLRRVTSSTKGPARVSPLVLMLAALLPLAWLCMFMQWFVFLGIPLLSAAWLLGARRIWLDPRGKVAMWLARGLLVLGLATGGVMVWDMSVVLDYQRDGDALRMAGLLAAYFCVCMGLCVFAARRGATLRN